MSCFKRQTEKKIECVHQLTFILKHASKKANAINIENLEKFLKFI